MEFYNLLKKLKDNKYTNIIVKVLLGLLISITLTIVCMMFTPSIFTATLNTGLNFLPPKKYLEYKVQTKQEFAKQWLEEQDALMDDKEFFDYLRSKLPANTRPENTFFAHMFIVHDYPARCLFTIFGKHRTIDITWTIEGKRCKNHKQCNDPQFIYNCPPLKARKK